MKTFKQTISKIIGLKVLIQQLKMFEFYNPARQY